MPEAAVYLEIRCLQPGCEIERWPLSTSVGIHLTDSDREETAEAFVWFQARTCRERHAAGVEARFSDDPDRRILFSQSRRVWA